MKKKFDAVKMMRDIRDELSAIYSQNPEQEEKDLKAIREMYGIESEEDSSDSHTPSVVLQEA